jgi:hypothetical protein
MWITVFVNAGVVKRGVVKSLRARRSLGEGGSR